MAVFPLLGVLLGEFVVWLLLLLYALPLFLMVVGFQFVKAGMRDAAVAADHGGLIAARRLTSGGQKVFLFGVAVGLLIFFRTELFRCVLHLF